MRKCKNWLTSYLKWTDKIESPELFHLWTGITTIACALGRKVVFNRGHYNLYPNIYTILIAGSALCRKSTAVSQGEKLLAEVGCIKVIRDKITTQRLLQAMGCDEVFVDEIPPGYRTEALIYAPELTTLLNQEAFKSGLIDDLTALYDCPKDFHKETKHSGCDYLYNVYLSILGATTPRQLGEYLPRAAIGSGFTSRIMFVYQKTTPRRISRPEIFYNRPDKIKLWEDLLYDLREISKLEGQFTWTNEAIELFDEWYAGFREAEDERLEGYLGRKDDHAIKLAMIISAGVSDKLVINLDTLKSAITILEEQEKSIPKVYSMLSMDSNLEEDIMWVLMTLKRLGGQASHTDVLRKGWNRFDATRFKLVIEEMRNEGMISMELVATGTKYKKIYTIIESEAIKEMMKG